MTSIVRYITSNYEMNLFLPRKILFVSFAIQPIDSIFFINLNLNWNFLKSIKSVCILHEKQKENQASYFCSSIKWPRISLVDNEQLPFHF